MARRFTDADFSDDGPRRFSESDFADAKDAPADIPRTAQDAGEALLTNLPTKGLVQDIVRGLPASGGGMAGGIAGAAAGAAFGPPGMIVGGILGAGLGGAAGEATRQAISQGTAAAFPEANYPVLMARQVAGHVGVQGAAQAAGEGLGIATGAALRAAARPSTKIGAQVMRVMTGVPEKTGQAVLRDPGILSRALPIDEAGKVYQKGIGEAAQDTLAAGRAIFGKTYPGAEAALNTFDELSGALEAAHPNELLGMRQGLSDALSDVPATSPKLRKLLADRLVVLDKILEGRLPDWGGAKQAWREAKIGEEFASWLPLNKNLSPNVLRTTAGIAAAGKGLIEGSPWMAIGLPLISPRVWGGAIRMAGAVGKIPAGVYRSGIRVGAGTVGSALEQSYLNNKSAGSRPDLNRPIDQ